MKHIKRFNENFEHIPDVIRTVEQMLYQIEDFEFSTEVKLEEQNFLTIKIKKDSDEMKVFYSSDIKDTLLDINNYLTLGEGFKLLNVFATRIPISASDISLEKLIKTNMLILDCELVYELR
jgi:hypothetical protein